MIEKMVIQQNDRNEIKLTDEVYERFLRIVLLLGDRCHVNSWENTFYLLVLLYNCIDIRIPYVIEKNYNFFSEEERKLLKRIYFELKKLIDDYRNNDILCEVSETNIIMNQFMSLYDTINNFFEFRLYAHRRNVLLIELQKCLSEKDYMQYRTKLLRVGEDITELKKVVPEGEKIILEDWRKKLTDPREYQEGEEYAFICHAGGPVISKLVSASLLTDKIFAAYNGAQILFILDYSSMFNTESSDCYIYNGLSDPILAKQDHLYWILTKDTLEEQTLEMQEKIGKEHYNEINLYEFKPIGILVMIRDEHDFIGYSMGEEKHQKYPDLPMVYINKSIYKQKNLEKLKK